MTNGQEFIYGTDPSNPDSDSDGKTDGEEVANGTNPLNPGEREYDVYIPLIKK